MNYDKTIELDMPLDFLPKQLDVLNLIKSKGAVLYSGAFRAGKTKLLVNAAIMICLQNPGTKGMLISQVSSQLKNAVFDLCVEDLEEFQDAINKKGIDLRLAKSITQSPGNMQITFYNKSLIYFRSCRTKEEQRKIASITLDFYGLDEPVDMDVDVFNQLIGRKSGTGNLKHPFGLLTTNPGSELHWLYDAFYIRPANNFAHVECNTRDNRLLPHYDDYIRDCEERWPEDWRLRYLDGKWGAFSGQVFKTFISQKHIRDVSEVPCKYYIAAVDYGLRDPSCILIAGVTNDNRMIIKEEFYKEGVTSHELAKKLQGFHKTYNFRKVYIDPSAADLIQQTYELGVPAGKRTNEGIKSWSNRDIAFGIARLNSLFKHNMIVIDTDCINLKEEIPAYRYQEGTDKPKKGQKDHAVDTARYLVTDFDPFHSGSWFNVVYDKLNKWG